MKKTVSLLLAVLMALSLCGCAESLQQIEIPPFPEVTPTPSPVETNSQTPAPTEAVPPATEVGAEIPVVTEPAPTEEPGNAILVNIGRTVLKNNDPAEGEELILDFSYDMPRVIYENDPIVAQEVNEVLATIEETFYSGQDYGLKQEFIGYNAMLEAAEDNYTWVREYQVSGHTLELSDCLSAKVQRLDGDVLSILYSDTNYTGGAHGSYFPFAYNFDLTTGQVLTLDRLSGDYDALADYLVQTMLEMAEQDPDGTYSIKIEDSFLPAGGREEAFRNLLREGSWYLDREGMMIFSNLYELGPYAAGITEFRIPYALLEGKIESRFLFPADRTGKGRITVDALSNQEGGELAIVDKLVVSEDGQQLCLIAEGEVYDVRISTVYYVDQFYEDAQLWCANSLKNCALQLQAVVPEGLPNLLITYYTADGERHGKLLSQSSADGSFMLVDDNIAAVG